MITDFAKDTTKPEYDRIHDNHVYSVCQRRLGAVRDGDGWRYLTDDEKGFEHCQHKVIAYVCYDSKKRSDDEQELKAALMAKIKNWMVRGPMTLPRHS